MSSLRLALKQSLQETGHLAPQKKKGRRKASLKASSSNGPNRIREGKKSSRQKQPRDPGDPPRKRGRPRKHPRPDVDAEEEDMMEGGGSGATGGGGGGGGGNPGEASSSYHHQQQANSSDTAAALRRRDDDHHHSDEDDESSENEFYYDSEEEETDDSEEEEDDSEDDEEDSEGEEDDDDEEEDEEDGHEHSYHEEGEEHEEGKVPSGTTTTTTAAAATTIKNHDESHNIQEEFSNDVHQQIAAAAAASREGEDGNPHDEEKKVKVNRYERSESDEERRRQRKLFKKQLNAAANKIQSHWKKTKAKSTSISTADADDDEDPPAAAATKDNNDDDSPSQDHHDPESHQIPSPRTKGEKEEEEASPSGQATAAATEDDANTSQSVAGRTTPTGENYTPTQANIDDTNDDDGGGGDTTKNIDDAQTSVNPDPTSSPQPKKKKKKKKDKDDSATKTVPAPIPEILEWSRNLSERKCRKNIASGLRVKVRFSAKVKRDGKVVKKKIWYGGRVSAVSKEGSKIRIKYDDNTSEISKFPDKDVVVDETSNGQHLVSGDRFLPPSLRLAHQQEEEGEEEEFVETDNMFETAAAKTTTTSPESTMKPPVETTKGSAVETTTKTTSPTLAEAAPQSTATTTNAANPTEKPPPETKKVEDSTAVASSSVTTEPAPAPAPAPESSETTTTPLKKPSVEPPETSEETKKPKEPKDSFQMTPVARITLQLPKDVLSPEEGELSPGITLVKKDAQPEEKQPDPAIPLAAAEDMVVGKPVAPDTKEPTKSGEDESKEPTKDEAKTDNSAPAIGSPSDTHPHEPKAEEKKSEERKLSLTIRIPNLKSKDHIPKSPRLQQQLLTPKSPKGLKGPIDGGETSEEELFADTPVTLREVKSIDLRKYDGSKKKGSKKRPASDSPGGPEKKKRIHLKKDRDPNTATKGEAGGTPRADKDLSENVAQTLAAAVPMPNLAPSIRTGPLSPKEPTVSISLRKQPSEIELAIPLAPSATKTKRKKDRASSPNPRKSPSTVQRSSPVIEQVPADTQESPAAIKPVMKELNKSASGEVDGDAGAAGGTTPVSRKGVIGSENSAFAKRTPAKDSKDETLGSLAPSNSDGDNPTEPDESMTPVTKATKTRESSSKASSEASFPTGRSGRRAAQQAKEKLNSKGETPGPESGKKKKKRKRRADGGGDSGGDGEESDHEDDPQWVQCDKCSKWRILPTSVDASTLPKHWYCHLNVYDPKRNNCSAPEQTLKQVAKERRRAKKRAKQQRLEQERLEIIPEDAAPAPAAAKEKGGARTPLNSPKSTKVVISAKKLAAASAAAEAKRLAVVSEEPQQKESDSGSDSLQKTEKKGKKGRPAAAAAATPKEEKDDSQHSSAADIPPEAPKVKVGRKRGRPARNAGNTSSGGTSSQEKKEDDNVQWVQCEKCEKWRKLPTHIDPDELPDTWYCSMNTWDVDLTCESPEDKADASHLEVGRGAGQLAPGNPGKNSYRSLIFGTGRKHNRPMSERSRAAESLFMRPIDDEENPHPTVMYSKSSVFLPRTSNFTKNNTVEEEKRVSIFEVLSNSDLFTELSSMGQKPSNVLSSVKGGKGGGYPKFVKYESLPEEMRISIREAVLHALGSSSRTGEDLICFMKSHSWDSEMSLLVPYFNADTVINAVLALVRDGIVEMACFRDPNVPMSGWIPKYRRVRSKRALASEEAMKASRCMKIRKPWKHREEDPAKTEWISGASAKL